MRIAIVGCGTAGQAASLFLHRAGHDVTVFERSPTLDPVGAGLLLQPTGMAVLDQLGAGEALRALAIPIHRLHGVTRAGRSILDVRYADLQPDLVGWGVHRGALFSTLLALMRSEGIGIRPGVRCASYTIRDRQAELFDDASISVGVFDLLIVADGARSTLRSQCPSLRRASQYPWAALWFVASDPESRFGNVLFQTYDGTRRMIGFLPSGSRAPGEPGTVSVFWSVRASDLDAVRGGSMSAFKQDVRALTSRAEPILEQISSMDQLVPATYHDVVLGRTGGAPVVLIGDAAHAMSPQLGQGANLALMDASALASALAGHEVMAPALRAYDDARRSHTRFYQQASRWLTPIFQSDHDWLAIPRDAFLGPLCHWPPTRRLMLESLAGIRSGWRPGSRLTTSL